MSPYPSFACPLSNPVCSKAGYFASATKSATCSLCPKGKQCPLIATS